LTDESYDVGNFCSVGTGECYSEGEKVCLEDKLGTECNAIELDPTEEICDGLDNNCNGEPDDIDDYPLYENQHGVCENSRKQCFGRNGWGDPDFSSIPDYEENESTCDSLDNDCDNSIDENITGALSNNQNGVCKDSRTVCQNGTSL